MQSLTLSKSIILQTLIIRVDYYYYYYYLHILCIAEQYHTVSFVLRYKVPKLL